MTALLSLVLVLLPLVAATWATRAVLRWVGSDGGARPRRAARYGEWSGDLPSVPYALR